MPPPPLYHHPIHCDHQHRRDQRILNADTVSNTFLSPLHNSNMTCMYACPYIFSFILLLSVGSNEIISALNEDVLNYPGTTFSLNFNVCLHAFFSIRLLKCHAISFSEWKNDSSRIWYTTLGKEVYVQKRKLCHKDVIKGLGI